MKFNFTWVMTMWKNVKVENWHSTLLMLIVSQRLAWKKKRKNDKWIEKQKRRLRVDCNATKIF